MGSDCIVNFSMESAAKMGQLIQADAKGVTVIPVSNMRAEMKLFTAVYGLNSFPMREMILNPLKHMKAPTFPALKAFDYKGYVSKAKSYHMIARVVFHAIQP